MAFKLGFRWRPVDFPVESTPLETPPPCHFNPFRTRPFFDASPALNVIPTMLDQLPAIDTTAPPLPWGTAPVPPLQPLPQTSVRPKRTPSKETADASGSGRTRPKTRSTTTVQVTTKPTPTPTPAPPAVRPGPPQQAPPPARRRPIARPRPIPLAPVTLYGVPGSGHRGVDLVSEIF